MELNKEKRKEKTRKRNMEREKRRNVKLYIDKWKREERRGLKKE
jgi:hypothetical protein